jgi:hypothetical protein
MLRASSRSVQFCIFWALVLFASISLVAQTGTTYYVSTTGSDGNPGTLAAPWLTIQHAATTATAGATVYVMGGVYNQIVSFPNSGTATEPITFASYPGQTAVIDGTGLAISGTQGLITISGARSYITVSGFEIRNLSTTKTSVVPCGVWITGSGTGVQIQNNLIHNIVSPGKGNGCGLFAYGTSQTPISGLIVNGNELYDLQTGESESMTFNGNVTNFQITNNLVHDNYNIGIDIIGYEKTGPTGYDQAMLGVVSGNTVYNISGIVNSGETDEYDADGLYCDGCAYITWEKNVVFQTDYGIETTSENQLCGTNGTDWASGTIGVGTPATGKLPCYGMYNTVRDNLFYEANSCGMSIGGYGKATTKGGGSNGGGSSFHDVFVNNTLYDNGAQPGNSNEGEPSGDYQIQYQVGSAQADYFENNAVYSGPANIWINGYNNSTTQTTGTGPYPAPPATLNYNSYYSLAGYAEGTSIVWEAASSYTNFANWQSVSGEDANSVNADPQFVAAGATPPDFETQPGSPTINAGGTGLSCSVGWCDPNGSSPNSIYGSTDFLGNPRMNGANIDIGAFENTGVPISNSILVTLTSGTSSLQPGQTTTLTATVDAIPGGAGVPSGTVNYMVGSTLLATQTLLPTSATTSAASMPISASQLPPGSNMLTAVYSGNSIAPCCSPSQPPGGSQTQIPVYPSTTSAPITVTFGGSPGIYNPVANSSLTGTGLTFQWLSYPSATNYLLQLGSTEGSNNYLDTGTLSSSTLSYSASSLPADGSTVWARWWYYVSGWSYIDYSYTAFGASSIKAAIASPTNNSSLTGSSATFTWNWVGASGYWIDAGSSPGGNQYFQSGNLGNVLTKTVSGLPTNGSTVYVTLYSMVNGQWIFNSYTYTAYNAAAAAAMLTTPNPGATLTSGTVTFDWSAGVGATAYWLDAGNSPGANNYHQSGNLGTALTTTVSGLPTDGSEIYVTLYSLIGGAWTANAYTYYALNATNGLAVMQMPTPGSIIVGNSATFVWSADASATAYWVDISAVAPGGNDVSQSGNLGDVFTETVNTLPANGSMIYVTLYSYVGGEWLSSASTYTSAAAPVTGTGNGK